AKQGRLALVCSAALTADLSRTATGTAGADDTASAAGRAERRRCAATSVATATTGLGECATGGSRRGATRSIRARSDHPSGGAGLPRPHALLGGLPARRHRETAAATVAGVGPATRLPRRAASSRIANIDTRVRVGRRLT